MELVNTSASFQTKDKSTSVILAASRRNKECIFAIKTSAGSTCARIVQTPSNWKIRKAIIWEWDYKSSTAGFVICGSTQYWSVYSATAAKTFQFACVVPARTTKRHAVVADIRCIRIQKDSRLIVLIAVKLESAQWRAASFVRPLISASNASIETQTRWWTRPFNNLPCLRFGRLILPLINNLTICCFICRYLKMVTWGTGMIKTLAATKWRRNAKLSVSRASYMGMPLV